MEQYTVYTAANDSRAAQLRNFIDYFRSNNSHQTLKVILFDRNCLEVTQLCKEKEIAVIEPSPIIDLCAKSIFGKGEYRPGVPSWKYMRKLNCFLDASGVFLFLDLNCIPTANLSPLVETYAKLKKDILFTTHSHAKRTIRVDTKQFLSTIDPKLGEGYNCSIIASQKGIINESIFKSLKGRRLRKMIAKAPEQGYLTIAMALCNISHGLFQHSDEFRSDYCCANSQVINDTLLDLDSHSGNIILSRKNQRKIIITYKSTGIKLTDLNPHNLNIFEQSKTKHKGLAKNSTPNKVHLTLPVETTRFNQEQPIKTDIEYSLKLYSPFRAGSNLVKATIEHNFSNIRVLNTGDNHWKHAFHAESKTYSGYIYCLRHPLNLIYSIQDYYFKVGRNIHSYGPKENFIRQPLTIYDEGVHRGRSPILFPHPIALINAWYFNYSHALKERHNKASKILYEDMMCNQKKAIKQLIESMNLRARTNNFVPINAKTKNLGDRRFNIEKDLQGKVFNTESSAQRQKCGLSDMNLLRTAKQEDIDFIIDNIDWSICNQLGYNHYGLTGNKV